MANLTTATADSILDHVTGRTAYSMPTVFVGLYTTNPTEPAGTGGTEVSTTSTAYARIALGTGGSSKMAAASSGSTASNADLTWTTATADWGTVTGVGLFTASTGGSLIASGALTASKTVSSGDTFSISSGDLTLALS